MSQASPVLTAYLPTIDIPRYQLRTAEVLLQGSGAAPADSGKPAGDAEAIVGEMVRQFFGCSTSMSNTILGW